MSPSSAVRLYPEPSPALRARLCLPFLSVCFGLQLVNSFKLSTDSFLVLGAGRGSGTPQGASECDNVA